MVKSLARSLGVKKQKLYNQGLQYVLSSQPAEFAILVAKLGLTVTRDTFLLGLPLHKLP